MSVKNAKAQRASTRGRSAGSAATHPLVAELAANGRASKSTRPPARISHDRRNIDPKVVDASQRWRLLAATAHVIASYGYGLTTIDKITSEAGVTKKTFYKFFVSKEEAFLACYGAVDVLIERVVSAGHEAKGHAAALRTMIGFYLAALAAVPDLTRIFLFEAIAASPRIRRQRATYIERLAEGLVRVTEAQREKDATTPVMTKADMTLLLGGINELCVLHITHEDIATVETLADDICERVGRIIAAQR